uniref:Saposin A-type domain-containing protein n=1 Tax=Clastoptera arizonana TaxID=38151 RepID=A0A1B6DTG4_9HEMI
MRIILSILLIAILPGCFLKDSVKLTIFYESYCPDSITFFIDQLGPVWENFSDAILLDLVPYGFAKQEYKNGHWHFTCQHGEKECIGNILHACSINELITSHYQPKYRKLLHLVNCFMESSDQYKSAKKCCKQQKVNYKSIKKCEKSKKGENLESGYGNRTNDFIPKIEWVPTAVVNDVFNQDDQDKAMTDLASVICKYIPYHKHCSN